MPPTAQHGGRPRPSREGVRNEQGQLRKRKSPVDSRSTWSCGCRDVGRCQKRAEVPRGSRPRAICVSAVTRSAFAAALRWPCSHRSRPRARSGRTGPERESWTMFAVRATAVRSDTSRNIGGIEEKRGKRALLTPYVTLFPALRGTTFNTFFNTVLNAPALVFTLPPLRAPAQRSASCCTSCPICTSQTAGQNM
jgi:hypothetical protein